LYNKNIRFLLSSLTIALLLFLSVVCQSLYAASDVPYPNINADESVQREAEKTEITASVNTSDKEKLPDDKYGDVTEEEAGYVEEDSGISDPIEPLNRAVYHFNDKFYFWVWKPASQGYRYVVPEDVRGLFSSFYKNIKAPVRIINNLLQGKPKYAGLEFVRFFINSTLGVGGLRDCAKECFGVTGRDADFGQTLGKYGVGFGFYLVLPFLGPSSPRDGIGWVVDWTLKPTTYIGNTDEWFSPQSVGLFVHEKVNYTSFHIGDYEILKEAAIDPYISMRDAYVQYRKKLIER
jgi:phospholipid-binding lipoprotein MlaA